MYPIFQKKIIYFRQINYIYINISTELMFADDIAICSETREQVEICAGKKKKNETQLQQDRTRV